VSVLVGLFAAARKNLALCLVALAALTVMCGLAWCWGLAVGQQRVEQANEHSENVKLVQAHEDYRKAVSDGETVAMSLRDELEARDATIASLKRSLKNVPNFVATAACPSPGDVELSGGALLMWNTALASGDQQLPASACGAAAGHPGASAAGGPDEGNASGVEPDPCKSGSGVSLTDWQANAQTNAEGFGACYARLKKLTSYLRQRQADSSDKQP
jgi:hypothetical protein